MTKLTGFKKVAVVEQCGKNYYFALYDNDINAGDFVLVSNGDGLKKIKEVISADEAKDLLSKPIISEVICKVDMSSYNKRVANRGAAEKLKKEMDKKISEMNELNKYEMWAEKNDDLAKMLAEYKGLIGNE